LVQLYGRIGVQAYNNLEGNARASLTFHCNTIKVLATPKGNTAEPANNYAPATYQQQNNHNPEGVDDLPF